MSEIFFINQHTKLEDITSDLVKSLLEQDKGEDIYFDFKAGVKTDNQNYKYKVRKCLASFANTFGGFVFFGIQDNKSKQGLSRLEGIERNAELGKEINDKFLSGGLCVPGIDFEGPHFVNLDDKNIAVIKILVTEKKPYAIKEDANSSFEFWSRGSGTAKPMDYFEIVRLVEEGREKRNRLISLFLDVEEIISIADSNISGKDSDRTLPRKYNSIIAKEWGGLVSILSSELELLRKLFPLKTLLVGADDARDYLFSQSVLPLNNKTELVKNGNLNASAQAEHIKKQAESLKSYLFEKYSGIREFVALANIKRTK